MSQENTAPAVAPGVRFGMLVVIEELERRTFPCGASERVWLCRCDCGRTARVLRGNLTSGRSKGCGCRIVKHGRCYSRAYHTHNGMMMRCYNPNSHSYPDYGGRGIEVAKEWHTFETFYRDMGDPPEGASLERLDNSQGYSRQNCIWASAKRQQNNKRSNRVVTFAGQTRTLMQWSEATGVNYHTLHGRLSRGLPLERVFSPTPLWQR